MAMNFDQFRKFLDLNPVIRTIFIRAINPQIWTLQELPSHYYYLDDLYLEFVAEKGAQF
jgi:hypothetical protein